MAYETQTVVDWQVPAKEESETRRKGWVEEQIQNGDRWLKSQKSIQFINDDVQLLMGGNQDLSVESNGLQTDIRTFVETISDLRQIGIYGSSAPQFEKYLETYNKTLKFIFQDSNFVYQMRKALQYAMLGRGYLWSKFSRDKYGWGKARHIFDPLGPLEVIPDQLPADNDIQGAYSCTIIRPMPIAEAHARFPGFQEWLKPISRYDWKAYGTLGMARRLDFYDRWRFGDENNDWDTRYCEMRYTFVRDLRINRSGQRMQMGVAGSSWGYEVPTVGELIVTKNPFNGLPESHNAVTEECRMYPQLRLIITSPTVPVPLYDDTAFDWHGEIPVVSVDVNDWAWSPIGYSIIHGVASLERARRRLVSRIDEVIKVNLDPPMGHDLTKGVSREQMKNLDIVKSSGLNIGTVGKPSDALQSLLPDGLKVNGEDFKDLEMLNAMLSKNLGLNDVTSMREMKMNISEASMDKILENLGPISKGIAMNIGMACSKLLHMLKYSIPQNIPVGELISIVGQDGVTIETFDNDPNSLIPSHLPGELEDEQSKHEKKDRAKWFCDRLAVSSVPTQLLNFTQQQERMMYMFFLQKGAPVPMSVIMEKLGVQGYETLREQWKAEKIDELMFQFRAQLLMAIEQKNAGLQPPEGGPGQGKGGGRPSSGKKPGHQEIKGAHSGNVRVVNSTS